MSLAPLGMPVKRPAVEPAEAAIPYVVFDGKDDNKPKAQTAAWSQLVKILTTHAERESKDGPLFSPATYKPGTTRANVNVEAINTFVADIDHDAQPVIDSVRKTLAEVAFAVYSTHSHTPDEPKIRVVIQLAESIEAADWPDAWARFNAFFGGRLCPNSSDISRMYYLPAHPPGAHPFAYARPGEPFDWRTLPRPTSSNGHIVLPTKVAGPLPDLLPDGTRNEALVSLAGTLRRRGLSVDEIDASLQAFNESRGNPPLDTGKVRKIAESIGTRYQPVDDIAAGGDRRTGFALTDTGNAERFAAAHGDEFRYTSEWDWLRFDGKRWARDLAGERFRASKAVTRGIYHEAGDASDDDRRKAIATWARSSESQSKRDSMLALARWERPITATVDQFDADLYSLNVANGTVDLRTGELRPHNPADLISRLANVDYDPAATAPTFERFLERVIPSAEVRGYLQHWAGYAATGSTREERLGIWHGSGDNGKSTLERLLVHVLGDYAKQIDPEILMASRNDQHPTGKADLLGVRAAFAAETDQGRRFAESRVKNLVSTDRISARLMRQDFFTFEPSHSLVLLTNHKPEIKDTGHGMWRRLDLVPFTVTIPDHEKDHGLIEKLKAESPGVLAWIVAGAVSWYRSGLPRVAEITAATAEYRRESDTLGEFLAEKCILAPTATIAKKDLYAAYATWSEPEKPVGKITFGAALTERGVESERGTGGTRRWVGIRLRTTSEPEPSDKVTSSDELSTMYEPEIPRDETNPGSASLNVTCHSPLVDDDLTSWADEVEVAE